jgi:hypothetical protein
MLLFGIGAASRVPAAEVRGQQRGNKKFAKELQNPFRMTAVGCKILP